MKLSVKLTTAAIGLVSLLLCAMPASAQTQAASGDSGSGGSIFPGLISSGGDKEVDPATQQKRREVERAYQDATRGVPAQQQATNDPWANMRGGDEHKPAAKPIAKTAQKKKPAQ